MYFGVSKYMTNYGMQVRGPECGLNAGAGAKTGEGIQCITFTLKEISLTHVCLGYSTHTLTNSLLPIYKLLHRMKEISG